MRKHTLSGVLQVVSLMSLGVCIVIAIWGMKQGIFTSKTEMEHLLGNVGVLGPLLFILFQCVQVVIPILPGGVSCLAGVVLFGAWKGFAWNYIGICIGSAVAFALSKSCGRPLIESLFGTKLLQKYDSWTENKERFDKMFALAIFLPVAPDDFLCYLAGTTTMSWRRFVLIILMGKPLAIALYSMLLNTVWMRVITG